MTVGENDRGPYLGLLIVPGGAAHSRRRPSAICASAVDEGSVAGARDRGGWHRGMPRQQNQDKGPAAEHGGDGRRLKFSSPT